jgi:hypothetical protein
MPPFAAFIGWIVKYLPNTKNIQHMYPHIGTNTNAKYVHG